MTNGSETVSQQIAKRLNESARIKEEIARKSAREIQAIAELIIDAYRNGGKVVLFGNHIIDDADYQAFVWIRDNLDEQYEKAVMDPWKGAAFAAITEKYVYSWISAYPTERDKQARAFLENDCRDTAFLKENGISIVYTRWVCDNPDLVPVRENVYLLETDGK
jgi:hypothetical protein